MIMDAIKELVVEALVEVIKVEEVLEWVKLVELDLESECRCIRLLI